MENTNEQKNDRLSNDVGVQGNNYENIWQSYDFNYDIKTKHEMLRELCDGLSVKTNRILRIDITLFEDYDKNITKVYVTAPKLGNYQRLIMSVRDYDERYIAFPANLINEVSGEEIKNVTEDEFVEEVSKILNSKEVRTTIENLYYQSVEQNKK